ncbi:MAG: hypothetical protein RLZZ104_80, partial [Pseudomonadota bacterium]
MSVKGKALADAPDSEAIIGKARSLLQSGQLADAARICQKLLENEPKSGDALYILAVANRLQKKFNDALSVNREMIALDPSNGRAHQEMGHCLRDMGDSRSALAAYQEAVARNNALAGSWQMLERLHEAAGHTAAADFAAAQVEYLTSLPPQLQAVASLIQEGKMYKAEQLCRHFLQSHGHHVEAMRFLAQIGMSFNVHDEAEFLLESAVMLDPENSRAHFDYVGALQKRQKFADALEQARLLREKEPDDPQVDMLYANQNLAIGNFDEALRIYRSRVAQTPNNPGVHLTLGHALKTTGQQQQAIEAYTRAYTLKPDYGDAYW